MPRRRKSKKRRNKPNWFRRRFDKSVGTVRTVVAEPRNIGTMLHDGLLKIWRTRGGGFFGLGYVVCFVVLEVRAFIGNFEGDGDAMSMVLQEVAGFFFRFTAQSFLNTLLAFLWPAFVIEYLEGWGILLVGAGWLVFDRWLKPQVNAWLPGLKPAEIESPEATTEAGEQE